MVEKFEKIAKIGSKRPVSEKCPKSVRKVSEVGKSGQKSGACK
jgi:hypothetical protein